MDTTKSKEKVGYSFSTILCSIVITALLTFSVSFTASIILMKELDNKVITVSIGDSVTVNNEAITTIENK